MTKTKKLEKFDLGQFLESYPGWAGGYEDRFYLRGTQLIYLLPSGDELSINARSEMDYHRRYFYKNSIYQEPLARALGIKKGQLKPRVVDCSAGRLKDSLLILNFQVDLIAFERNQILGILIEHAIIENDLPLQVFPFSAHETDRQGDSAYFDPMYDEVNKKSAPKKDMRIFRKLVGKDLDAKEVAQTLKNLYPRLVIKRPIKASELLSSPNMSFRGKSTRYDVYLNLD